MQIFPHTISNEQVHFHLFFLNNGDMFIYFISPFDEEGDWFNSKLLYEMYQLKLQWRFLFRSKNSLLFPISEIQNISFVSLYRQWKWRCYIYGMYHTKTRQHSLVSISERTLNGVDKMRPKFHLLFICEHCLRLCQSTFRTNKS